jgi:hypothetical protein
MSGMERQGQQEIAPPDEDPNAVVVCSSPPCFMHELDPSYLGYLRQDEVCELLEALCAAEWPGTKLEAAWLHAMLQRHLTRLNATRFFGAYRSKDMAACNRDNFAAELSGHGERLTNRLRDALPRIADGVLCHDLREVLMMMERNLRWRHGTGVT